MNIINYYLKHGIMTQSTSKDLLSNLPTSVDGITKLVQTFMIHQHMAPAYDIELTASQKEEPFLRSFQEKLILLKEKGYTRLSDHKPYKKRLVSICRDFAVVSAALCREVGIPARARCGFATYFEPGKYIDHWVLEYYNETEQRWILADTQIDDLQRKHLNIDFNILDLDESRFLTGDLAWRYCREGKLKPELFGIFTWWGYDYLNCNLILDANSLLKVPMQPWDTWKGFKNTASADFTEKDYEILDKLSSLMRRVNEDFTTFRNYVINNEAIRVPDDLDLVSNTCRFG